MEPEDLDLLYHIENDPKLWLVSATSVPYSRYTLHDYIAHSSGNIYADGQVRLMIENEDGLVVGIADIVNFEAKHRRAEVGIVIELTQRRKGYALQALNQITDYSLRVLHLHQLYAIVAANNLPSVSLFKVAGFIQTAVVKDWLYDGEAYSDALILQRVLTQ